MNLKDLYAKKINIMEYLRNNNNIDYNDKDIIKYSYDIQAGSYVNFFFENNELYSNVLYNNKVQSITNLEYNNLFFESINKIFNSLSYDSFVDAGTGEATTLYGIINYINKLPKHIFALDLSLSRVLYGQSFLNKMIPKNNTSFITGNIFELPFINSSIDLVFTCHSIEPNTDKEKDILTELYRVSNKYIVMIEPSFNLGNEKTKENILKHKYIKNLYKTAKELNYNIIEYRLFDIALETNNSEVIIIEKKPQDIQIKDAYDIYGCPICNKKLQHHNTNLFCNNCLLIYPIINNIPVLNKEYGILCSKFLEF